MIDISSDDRRRAFALWLRTGRLPSARSADGIELKFNPWHDPGTGRFTFAGGGASRSGDGPVRSRRSTSPDVARRTSPGNPLRPASHRDPGPSSSSGATGGKFVAGGGGRFRGAGASGTVEAPASRYRSGNSRGFRTSVGPSGRIVAAAKPPRPVASVPNEGFRTVVRNGYAYQIDSRERTRRVSGALVIANARIRSRTSQRQAGGADRRASDDGGHYVAVRFNGPSDAFNHFAQDSNFNRGVYRRLEDEWAREKRAGRMVTVKIVPQFDSISLRPSKMNVWWKVDGKYKSVAFPNEPSERRRGGK